MATIKIKKRIDVIEVEYMRALELKKRWLGLNGENKRDGNDTFNIDDRFAGTYSQIEWVDTKQEIRKIEPVKMSNQDARAFEEKELKHYLNSRGYLVIEREFDFLSDKGCLVVRKIKPEGEGRTAADFRISIVGRMVDQYEKYSKLIDDWKDYRSRTEYAQRRDLQSLDTSRIGKSHE